MSRALKSSIVTQYCSYYYRHNSRHSSTATSHSPSLITIWFFPHRERVRMNDCHRKKKNLLIHSRQLKAPRAQPNGTKPAPTAAADRHLRNLSSFHKETAHRSDAAHALPKKRALDSANQQPQASPSSARKRPVYQYAARSGVSPGGPWSPIS